MIDAISLRDLDLLGDSDSNHLRRATEMGRVLVTSDTDFLYLATQTDHSGIIFGTQNKHSLGDWVKQIALIYFVYIPDDFRNHVEYL